MCSCRCCCHKFPGFPPIFSSFNSHVLVFFRSTTYNTSIINATNNVHCVRRRPSFLFDMSVVWTRQITCFPGMAPRKEIGYYIWHLRYHLQLLFFLFGKCFKFFNAACRSLLSFHIVPRLYYWICASKHHEVIIFSILQLSTCTGRYLTLCFFHELFDSKREENEANYFLLVCH